MGAKQNASRGGMSNACCISELNVTEILCRLPICLQVPLQHHPLLSPQHTLLCLRHRNLLQVILVFIFCFYLPSIDLGISVRQFFSCHRGTRHQHPDSFQQKAIEQ